MGVTRGDRWVALVLCGLRDKTLFLAARSEQWLPALIFFVIFVTRSLRSGQALRAFVLN